MATALQFRCPLCMQSFQRPKLLQRCMHSFCRLCIYAYVTPLLSNDNKGRELDCPICKTSFQGPSSSCDCLDWLDNLPSDPLLQQHIAPDSRVQSSNNCEPCAVRNKTSVAIKFCKDCSENLCDQCADVHLASKGTRSHVLLNAEYTADTDMELSPNCEIHESKTIEYYCKTHDELICSKCAVINHRVCDILEIETASATLAHTDPTEQLKSDFELLHADIDKCEKTIQEENDRFQNEVQRALMDVEDKRKQVNVSFDRYKKKIVDEVKHNIKLGENAKAGNTRISTGIENSLGLLNTAIKCGNYLQVYKRSKALKRQVDGSRTVISASQSEYPSSEIEYSFSSNVTAIINDSNSVGTFHVKTGNVQPTRGVQSNALTPTHDVKKVSASIDTNICNDKTVVKSSNIGPSTYSDVLTSTGSNTSNTAGSLQLKTIETKCKPDVKPKTPSTPDAPTYSSVCSGQREYVEKKSAAQPTSRRDKFKVEPWGVSIESKTRTGVRMKSSRIVNVVLPDGSQPFFGGAAYLNDDRVVLTDVKNHRLILLDRDEQFVAELELERRPRKVSVTHKNKVAVGLFNSKKILIIKVGETLVISKCVYTSSLSKCVVSSNQQLFMSSYRKKREGAWKLTCFNLQNDEEIELEKITGFYDGTHMSIFNKDNTNFVLHSCRNDDIVKCHTEDGNEVFSYKLTGPGGLDVDKFGNIFVASTVRGKILHLAPTGQLVTTLMVGGLYKPFEVRLNKAHDKLLVTQFESSEIHVIRLAYP